MLVKIIPLSSYYAHAKKKKVFDEGKQVCQTISLSKNLLKLKKKKNTPKKHTLYFI